MNVRYVPLAEVTECHSGRPALRTGSSRTRRELVGRSVRFPKFTGGSGASARESRAHRPCSESRRVFREDIVAGLDSFVTDKARVHCLFVGERLEVFTKIRVTPTARRGVLLGVLLHKLQVPVGCVSGNERLRLTKCFVVLF